MMDTDISRISRKDLQRLHERSRSQSTASTEFNVDSYAADNNDDEYDHDDNQLDDFSLHDLRDIPLGRGGGIAALNSGSLQGKDLDLQSQTSSSAASTVIHNPNLAANEEMDQLVENVALGNTLETDEEFQSKLHRSLRLSNANNSILVDETFTNDDTIENEMEVEGQENEDMLSDENSVDLVEDLTSDKIDDYIDCMMPSPPASPPRELDPTKLYALFDFNGPDPSHLPLLKNDSVLLLNDKDSYWWLVRRTNDNRIGFAPAEILETYSERLARLNCWKNEILERGGYKGLKLEDEKILFKTDYPVTPVPAPEINANGNENENEKQLQENVTRNNESTLSIHIQRKGSLKKPDSLGVVSDATKKSVSFADNINEVQEECIRSMNEDDGASIVASFIDGNEDNNSVQERNYDDSSFSILGGYQNDSVEDNLDKASTTVEQIASPGENSNQINDITEPLVVPKKRRNFMIKNLDDYNYETEKKCILEDNEIGKENEYPISKLAPTSHPEMNNADITVVRHTSESLIEKAELDSKSPDSLSPSSSAGDASSFISSPSKSETNMNNVTVSSTYTASASPSVECIPKAAVIEHTQPLHITKTRSKSISEIKSQQQQQSPQQRLGSLKMLDDLLDMYPEFVTLGEGFRSPDPTNEMKGDKVLAENMDNLQLSPSIVMQSAARKGEDDHSFKKELHPRTASIFDPVLAQVRQLDELLLDLQDENGI